MRWSCHYRNTEKSSKSRSELFALLSMIFIYSETRGIDTQRCSNGHQTSHEGWGRGVFGDVDTEGDAFVERSWWIDFGTHRIIWLRSAHNSDGEKLWSTQLSEILMGNQMRFFNVPISTPPSFLTPKEKTSKSRCHKTGPTSSEFGCI